MKKAIPPSSAKSSSPVRKPAQAPHERPRKPSPAAVRLKARDLYIDRELSWLAFNRRVLEEAQDPTQPLLERLKFLGIVSSNLDEFFEVRVAALLQRIETGIETDGIAQLDAKTKLRTILDTSQTLVRDQYDCWRQLRTALRHEQVHVKKMRELSFEEEAYVHDYFRREVYHLLTPIKVDPAHPFPWVVNKALCLAMLLKDGGRGRESLGVVAVPRSLPRIVALPQSDTDYGFIFISDVIRHYASELFKGYPIKECSSFRITRNSNLYMDEDDDGDNLLEMVEQVVRSRRKGDVVRLEIDEDASPRLTDMLVQNFDIDAHLVYRVGKPVNLSRINAFHSLIPLPHLKYPPHIPVQVQGLDEGEALFNRIRAHDVLLHHPFESFDPVVRFIETVATDPHVMAIKTTLYRTSADSPIMFALMEAAQRGKEVVVVVELKARFDEQSNIHWARRLEERGGTVVYGLVGLKTHCKLALVMRKEENGFRRYAHVGTGNYNPETAKLYTDVSLLTCDTAITQGVSEVFNFLTANTRDPDFGGLWVSPRTFLSGTLELIHRERMNAKKGLPSGITAKFNALLDTEVIEALYAASKDGVEVRLIVRGICSLRPELPGVSDKIKVKSVVGRYLEHSRIYAFRNAGDPLVFIGSGDWMVRNLRERVEVIVPVRSPELRNRLLRILAVYWNEEGGTRWMRADGHYTRSVRQGKAKAWRAQDWFAKNIQGVTAHGGHELPHIAPMWMENGIENGMENASQVEVSQTPMPNPGPRPIPADA